MDTSQDHLLQQGFLQQQGHLGSLLETDLVADRTVVVIPSMTLPPEELKKIPGAVHFEQRLLFCFQLLRAPGTRIIYVTSERIDASTVDYALDLVTNLPPGDARARITMIDCQDRSPVPLTRKVLDRPDLLARIRDTLDDPASAYLMTYNSTPLERDLSLRLGIPLFACDPGLEPIGTKSGGREFLRTAGIPVLDGCENIRSETNLADALTHLKLRNPSLKRAVVKLNDSFAGAGNAIFRYAEDPWPPEMKIGEPKNSEALRNWVASELRQRLTVPSGDTSATFVGKIRDVGGVVEKYLDASDPRSPSAQVEIRPGHAVRILSTHDQLLGGPSGQTFIGCRFPARAGCRREVQDLALRAGRALAREGVLGQCSIDFVEDDQGNLYALEINLRMGGATAPFMFLHGLVNGAYDSRSGDYLSPSGRPIHYVASDRIADDRFRFLSLYGLIDRARREGLYYDPDTNSGVIFYSLGALAEFGKLGVIAIGDSPSQARSIYDEFVTLLTRETAILGK